MGFDEHFSVWRRPMAPLTLLGRPITGVVSWNMNDTCNYRCSYCTQRFKADRTYRLEEIQRYLDTFAKLPGDWEIKLSGGEPFQQPGLIEIVEGLVGRGHLVSIQTNFSASERKLRAFLEATRANLYVFSASLHLEYDTVDAFIEKAAVVNAYLGSESHFNVTSVATPSRLEELRDEVAPRFAEAGISFKIQPEKLHGRVRDYSPEERAILLELGGHNNTGSIAPNFRGRYCYAGANYFVIKSSGEAWRCYPASRLGGRFASLGSFTEGVTLLDGAHICPYTYCNCTVPIHRGMIQGAPAATSRDALRASPED